MTRTGLFLRGCVAAALCGLILLELFSARRPAADMTAPARIATTGNIAAAQTTGSATPSWIADVLARPLFSPSRIPPAPDTAGPAGTPRLSGIIVTTAGNSAVFTLASGKSVLIETGGEVGNLVVRGIAAEGVTVIGPDGLSILHTRFAANGSGGASNDGAVLAPPAAPFAALATASPMPDWMQQGPPDLPDAATWSGVGQLSHLPAAQAQPASKPLLSSPAGSAGP